MEDGNQFDVPQRGRVTDADAVDGDLASPRDFGDVFRGRPRGVLAVRDQDDSADRGTLDLGLVEDAFEGAPDRRDTIPRFKLRDAGDSLKTLAEGIHPQPVFLPEFFQERLLATLGNPVIEHLLDEVEAGERIERSSRRQVGDGAQRGGERLIGLVVVAVIHGGRDIDQHDREGRLSFDDRRLDCRVHEECGDKQQDGDSQEGEAVSHNPGHALSPQPIEHGAERDGRWNDDQEDHPRRRGAAKDEAFRDDFRFEQPAHSDFLLARTPNTWERAVSTASTAAPRRSAHHQARPSRWAATASSRPSKSVTNRTPSPGKLALM